MSDARVSDARVSDARVSDEGARGVVERIWLKRSKRGPMDVRASVGARKNRGLVGNANQGGRRQVTVLDADRWESHMRALGASLDPATRRANVLTRGVDLANSRGRVLRIGSVRVQIAGETKPCHQMDEALAGLQAVMRPNWGGGAFGILLDDGEISVGDAVTWDAADPEMQRSLFERRADPG